jgi:hypothetical protein
MTQLPNCLPEGVRSKNTAIYMNKKLRSLLILWHVELLLGSDREIINYTTAVTRQRPVNKEKLSEILGFRTLSIVRNFPK